ncbi:MAG TPA: class II fructose-bisphosphate aldolase [Candidatus Sulfomarinibacteraceae bacterium]|nr:class II fructose-bisphosphate aldolase [Candidatus Sulfomarinibacteraceae bacterium]
MALTTHEVLDEATRSMALAPPEERQEAARALRDACLQYGVTLASIGAYYRALADEAVEPLTVPAVNLRGLTYDLARAAWRAAARVQAGPLMFELAPSEAATGDQSFMEYAAMVLAAAVREGYRGPVFLQGDHFHVESEDLSPVEALCREALDAGMRQIDIDAADLVEAGATGAARHAANAQATAAMTAFIRAEGGSDVVVGGEVGVIGGQNTTPDDLRAFLSAYQQALPPGVTGLGKLSVQTGTRHGGVVRADGSVGDMPLDLALVERLSRLAREAYGLPGVVQHGASTLTLEQFEQLPGVGAIEVHLATAIQNMVFDHEALPDELRQRMIDELVGEAVSYAEQGADEEQGDTLSVAQRFYHNRWRAWGRFKRELWMLPQKRREALGATCEAWFAELFQALGVAGRRDELRRLYSAPEGET